MSVNQGIEHILGVNSKCRKKGNHALGALSNIDNEFLFRCNIMDIQSHSHSES